MRCHRKVCEPFAHNWALLARRVFSPIGSGTLHGKVPFLAVLLRLRSLLNELPALRQPEQRRKAEFHLDGRTARPAPPLCIGVRHCGTEGKIAQDTSEANATRLRREMLQYISIPFQVLKGSLPESILDHNRRSPCLQHLFAPC